MLFNPATLTDLKSDPAAAEPRSLVQLLAPGDGGVRDYVQRLHEGWNALGCATEVLALSLALAVHMPLATRLRRPSTASRPCTLLIHFSGYGYHPRGLCDWLVREVQAARLALGSGLRVVTVFHELFASGPPWRSAFWLSGLQAGVAARLAQASDAIWTNSDHHAQWLRGRVREGTPVHVQPVFSTIGEPARVRPFTERTQRLVVFGSASTRARALQRLPRHAALLEALGIQEVVEVGSGPAAPWQALALRHQHLGRLDEADLHRLLQDTSHALIDYPSVHLGKSTVFAGYAVQGCVVLNTAGAGPDADGLQAGLHYQTLGRAGTLWREQPQAMADAARAWYARHPLAAQLQGLAELCGLPLDGQPGARGDAAGAAGVDWLRS